MDASTENAILTMLRDQGKLLAEHGSAIARVEENLRNNSNRLFGNGQPGLVQVMFTRHENMETKFGELDDEIRQIKTEARVKKAYVIGWASCASTFITFACAWLGKKIGFHI